MNIMNSDELSLTPEFKALCKLIGIDMNSCTGLEISLKTGELVGVRQSYHYIEGLPEDEITKVG